MVVIWRVVVIALGLAVLLGGGYYFRRDIQALLIFEEKVTEEKNKVAYESAPPPPVDQELQEEEPAPLRFVNLDVPFAPQAPFAEWKDPRQQDGCEEASSLLAVYWARGKALTYQEAKDEILKMSAFQEGKYGSYRDTSAEDTAKRLIDDYFGFEKYEVREIGEVGEIIAEIMKESVVIIPANGRAMNNPHFTQPGPERHMLVIRGYDPEKKEFITNDIGIREGKNYRYPEDVLFTAIRDYPTGDHLPITGNEKRVIVVSK